MNHLAIETSTRLGSVALKVGEAAAVTLPVEPPQRTSAALLSLIHTLCESAGIAPRGIDRVSVSVGPGSFTGLRIGLMVAKTLAWANACPLHGLSTHDVIARQALDSLQREPARESQANSNAAGKRPTIASVIDAQRGQVFRQVYASEGKELVIIDAHCIIDLHSLAKGVMDSNLWWSGPGLASRSGRAVAEGLADRLVVESAWMPSAATVLLLGEEQCQAGITADCWTLMPVYGRPSAAEEKRAQATSLD